MKKIIFTSGLLMLLFLFIFFSFLHSWKKGGPGNEQPVEDPNLTKGITLINNTDKSLNVVIDFRYNAIDSIKLSDINIAYNKVDSIYIKKNEGGYFLLPIFNTSRIKFPEKINIKIKDSLGQVIKQYDKDEFFNSIEKFEYKNRSDIECNQTSWTLKIK
ncbi:hypothetical protein [Flavobacterium sp. PS2]|uniref:hypothetical protein n=1 Tax=Flavobacterium sp. PS2 TaxID=3384157 RepID=UPI00390CAB23